MADDIGASVVVMQGELDLLPPDPWNGQAPDPPAGAMQPSPPVATVEMEARGPGRPPDHSNNRAPNLTEYVARTYGSPLEHAAKCLALPIAALASEMGSSRLIAAQHKLAVGRFLARYTLAEPPKPVALAARMTSAMGEAHLQAVTAFSTRNRHAEPPAQMPVTEAETARAPAADVVLLGPPPIE